VERVCLDWAIAQLPVGYRQVFELHDVLGYQHHEIAEILGYSVGNSKSQLFTSASATTRECAPSPSTNRLEL
jgi:DNA-directed RNA polymerase specialized sigma24 family protein